MRNVIAFFFLILCCGMTWPAEKHLMRPAVEHTPEFDYRCLQTGDIVMRNGKGLISEMFRRTSQKDARFSHAGMVIVTNGRPEVFHMIEQEGFSGIKREPFESFCRRSANKGFAVFRIPLLFKMETCIRTYLLNQFALKVRFDDQFDLNTDDALYCTELVYKAILNCDECELNLSAAKGQNYVAPDDLYSGLTTQKIMEFNY